MNPFLQLSRVLVGILLVLVAPRIGALAALHIAVSDAYKLGFEKIGHETTGELIEFLDSSLDRLKNFWRAQKV